jgi:hypothetical protein
MDILIGFSYYLKKRFNKKRFFYSGNSAQKSR